MSSLSSVNRQLDNVEEQIAEAELKLAEKEDELERLKEAQNDLITNKNGFSGEEEICLEPEFSLKTFNGLKADSYDTFRELQSLRMEINLKKKVLFTIKPMKKMLSTRF